jgi:hypothetical protein
MSLLESCNDKWMDENNELLETSLGSNEYAMDFNLGE